MSDTTTVITNNVPRFTIDAWDLTDKERAEFDYVDWDAVERGEDSRTFFRYRGTLYDLGEFSSDWGITSGSGLPEPIRNWDGYISDSFFSGIVVRYVSVSQDEEIVVGRYSC